MSEEISDLTEKLLHYNHDFLKLYQEARETGTKKDFHEVIKPFADEVGIVNNQWRESMIKWVSKTSHKHIHLKQIDTTSNHIEQLVIQAFFPETSKKRFLNAHRTVEYFLEEILKEVKK